MQENLAEANSEIVNAGWYNLKILSLAFGIFLEFVALVVAIYVLLYYPELSDNYTLALVFLIALSLGSILNGLRKD